MATNSTNPGVTINILVPSALHKQLRHQALDQGVMMKDAVVAAIEAWVTPGGREAQVRAQAIRQVLAILDEGFRDRDLPGARKRALALLDDTVPWE
jgi:hypothetical protein